jgi:plasmid replication initiation protein
MQKLQEPQSKEGSVTQDNALVSASYRLSLDAKRLLLLGITKVDSKKPHWASGSLAVRVYADEWVQYYGTASSNVYRQIRNGLEGLYDSEVVINWSEESGKRFRWISRQEYKTGEGWVEFELTREVLMYLSSLYSTFTTYKLLHVGSLRSIYSIRIYELAIQFRSTGWRKMTIDGFREMLGVSADHYVLFADLKKRVLMPSIREINDKTNLSMTFELARKGRKFTHITLRFEQKKQLCLKLGEADASASACDS